MSHDDSPKRWRIFVAHKPSKLLIYTGGAVTIIGMKMMQWSRR